MVQVKPYLKTAAAGVLLGACLYAGADVVGEYTTYVQLRDAGLKYAEQDEELKKQIGHPYVDGPWYNASIGLTQSGHIAAVTLPLKGTKQITDLSVRAVRRPGYNSLAYYNLLGPAEWKIMDCTAMAPAPGGRVVPRSLIPAPPVPKVVDGKVVDGQACEECSKGGKVAAKPEAQESPKRRKRFWLF